MAMSFTNPFRTVLLVGVLFLLVLIPQFPVHAAANLTITPITWNIIGLDSNDVTSGPNHFPVGARVCNTGDTVATNVTSAFNWTSANALINIRPGTLTAYSDPGLDLNPTECTDFYYEVEVTRNSAAYDTTRSYTITAAADGGLSASTPDNRELYVEYLISQSRNSVTDVRLDGVSIPNGGTMVLSVGETYTIELVGSTATNGYNQLESFINFPNTIFQVLSVNSTYSVGPALDTLYADSCGWENDTTDPNYRSCVVSNDKAGGNVTVTYQVRILQVGAVNPQPLSTLLYDFSGSSFHYNSDFSVAARFAAIIDPTLIPIAKNFSPDPTNAGGSSKLTFTITNPFPVTLAGVAFSDTFPTAPGSMVVASPAGVSTAGCGTPTFAPAPGAGSISFSNGTVAPNSSCTVSVNVTPPVIGTYTNTSSTLTYLSGTTVIDTGNTASDTLDVNNTPPPPAPICGLEMAKWEMNPAQGLTVPPAPSFAASGVSPVASAGSGITTLIETIGNPPSNANSWRGYGFANAFNLANNDYFQFALNTSNYSEVHFKFDAIRNNPGPSSANIYYSNSSTGPFTQFGGTLAINTSWTSYDLNFINLTNTSGNTYFRIFGFSATNGNSGSGINLDNIIFTGCGEPSLPTLTKAFAPASIPVNSTSTLTFTVTNPNSVQITGVQFADSLPSGVEVAAVPNASTTGCGTPTFSPTAGATALTFTNGTIAASGTCTVSVDVTATTPGPHTNVSGFVSSTETGINDGPDGYATATLTALAPPQISKSFGSTPIFVGENSLLTFTISNPNQDDALTGIAFTDTYPAGVVNISPLTPAPTNTCGGTLTAAPGGGSISLANGALAGGQSCTVTITVTSSTAGTYLNVSGNVTSTNAGTGNTASAELKVKTPLPGISLLKQVSTTASGPWTKFVSVYPGDPVYYQFTVENIGDVPLTTVLVNDPAVDTSGCSFTDPLPVATPTVDPTSTCVVGPVTALSGSQTNTATAQGDYGGSSHLSDPSSATYVGAEPSISLLKQISTSATGPWSSAITGVAPGADVYYQFTVTNTGNVALESINVTDPDVVTSGCMFTDPLAASASTTCVVGPVTAASTIGVYTNTAASHGTYKYDGITYDSTPSSASYTLISPDLTVTKTNDTADAGIVSIPFTWTVTVTNAGTIAATFTDGQTILSDTLPAGATYGTPAPGNFTNINNSANISCGVAAGVLTCSASGADVTIGSSGSFTVSWTVTPTAAGDLANTAVVDPNTQIEESDETNNTGSNTVTVAAANPVMTVAKSSTTASLSAPGTVNYSYLVTNTGNVPLTGISLSDDNDNDDMSCPSTTLAVGANMTCTATHTFTQAELDAGGTLDNTVTASSNEAPDATSSLSIPISQNPAHTTLKSETSTGPYVLNDTISYSIVVTNTGNLTLTGVTVLDNSAVVGTCTPVQPASLAPGAAITCPASHVVTQADINAGSYANTATGDSDQTPPSDSTVTVNFTQNPSISILKSSDATGTNTVGDTVTYSYAVENTGDVSLTNVTVTDGHVGLSAITCTPAQGSTLLPAATMDCTATYTVTQADVDAGQIDNTGVVTGTPPTGPDVTDNSPLSEPIAQSASITLVKSPASQNVLSGGTANFTLTVTNSGNQILTGVVVTDPQCTTGPTFTGGDTNGDSQLDLTEIWTYSCSVANVTADFTNTADVTTTEGATDSATADVIVNNPVVGLAKRVVSVAEVSTGTWEVDYGFVVENLGNVDLSILQVTDDLSVTFPLPTTFSVQSVTSADFTVNPGYDGDTDINLLAGSDTLSVGSTGTISVVVQVVPTENGPFNNTATATAQGPAGTNTSDISDDGTDPDPNGNGDPTEAGENDLTPVIFGPSLFDPPFGIKVVDDSGLPALRWTMVWINNTNIVALNAEVIDPIPAGTTYIASGASSGYPVPGGAPAGSTNVGVSCTPDPASVSTTTTHCYYEGPTPTYPRGRIIWQGTLGPDLGASNAAEAGNELSISFLVDVDTGITSVQNVATINADLNGDGIISGAAETAVASAQAVWTAAQVTQLPETGFAPGRETVLPSQPISKAYQALGPIWLEIPALGVRTGITGVPAADGEWDVSWLGTQAGWLQGTAFPAFSGNSVVTGHVYLPNGEPGPFVDLSRLRWNHQVILHAFGMRYVYQVQSNEVILPDDLSALQHEESPWLSLLTCMGFDEQADAYQFRVLVRAVLTDVQPEAWAFE